MTVPAPDVEKGMRDWIRGLGTQAAERVWFSADPRSEFPYVIVSLVGSPPEASDAPIFHRLIQIDAIDVERQRTRCYSVMAHIEAALREIRQATALSADVVCYGATVQSVLYLPDPGSAAPRFSMTVEVTTKSTLAV